MVGFAAIRSLSQLLNSATKAWKQLQIAQKWTSVTVCQRNFIYRYGHLNCISFSLAKKTLLIFFFCVLFKNVKTILTLCAVQKLMMGQIWAPRLAVRWHKMLLSKCYLLCLKTLLEVKLHDIVCWVMQHTQVHTYTLTLMCLFPWEISLKLLTRMWL